jgi:two-component system, chemotaxis family, chemotaxis protein CheY
MESKVSGTNGSAARVLIVDDDPAMRMLCAINLELEGLVVLEAADGLSALAQARSEQPDLVLTDVSMPELDGFGLAEALLRDRRTRRIPLVFLSGETDVTYEARAQKLGALAYLTKPVDPLVLASRIVDVLTLAGKHERRQFQPSGPEPLAAA